jgi:arsenate reductase
VDVDALSVEGTELEKQQAFATAARYLRNRISVFVNLPIPSLDQLALETRLREIGRMEGKSGRSRSADATSPNPWAPAFCSVRLSALGS